MWTFVLLLVVALLVVTSLLIFHYFCTVYFCALIQVPELALLMVCAVGIVTVAVTECTTVPRGSYIKILESINGTVL